MAEQELRLEIVRVTAGAPATVPAPNSGAIEIVQVTAADPAQLTADYGEYYHEERTPEVRRAVEMAAEAAAQRALHVDLPGGVDPRLVKLILTREYPQMFFVANPYDYAFSGGVSRLCFFYLYSRDRARELEKAMNEQIGKILRAARRKESDMERLRCVYDWFAANCTYDRADRHPPEDYTAVGPLVHRKAVCAGFSRAFQLVCRRLGIDSAYIRGKLHPEDEKYHAWNVVWLDGNIYHVDVTAGVNFFEASRRIGYPCFLSAEQDLLRERFIEEPYPRGEHVPGTYLASIGQRFNSQEELDAVVKRACESAQRTVCLQAGDAYETQGVCEAVRQSMQRQGFGCEAMYSFATGVCIIIKGKSPKPGQEIQIIKLNVH